MTLLFPKLAAALPAALAARKEWFRLSDTEIIDMPMAQLKVLTAECNAAMKRAVVAFSQDEACPNSLSTMISIFGPDSDLEIWRGFDPLPPPSESGRVQKRGFFVEMAEYEAPKGSK